MEVDGELCLQKLDKDATYGTYVPQIKGYLLVVTPTTDKLCAHFHWSGDREITDYEEYVESNVALPTIPEMSEWGLAANIMFYMRSLVSETRNFIDRLMAGLGTSDATAVADRIVAAVTASEQPTVVSDEQMAE